MGGQGRDDSGPHPHVIRARVADGMALCRPWRVCGVLALGCVACARQEASTAAKSTDGASSACPTTVIVQAGDTLAAIARRCYGSRAYAERLGSKNAVTPSVLPVGTVLVTPSLQGLIPCGTPEVCLPLFTAHDAFLKGQALCETSAEKAAPKDAWPALDDAAVNLRSALRSAAAPGGHGSKTQIASALEELASLRAGTYEERGYPAEGFHQHLLRAIEAVDAQRGER